MSDLNRVILVLYRARYGAPMRSVHFVDQWCFTSSWQTAQGWPHTASSHVKCKGFKARSVWLLAAALLLSSRFPRNPSSEISHKLVAHWMKWRKTHALSARVWRVERQQEQDRATVIRTASQMDTGACGFTSSLCASLTPCSSLILYQN